MVVNKNSALKALLSAGVSYLVDELIKPQEQDEGQGQEEFVSPDIELDEVIPFTPTTPHFDPSTVPTLGVDSKNRLHNLVYHTRMLIGHGMPPDVFPGEACRILNAWAADPCSYYEAALAMAALRQWLIAEGVGDAVMKSEAYAAIAWQQLASEPQQPQVDPSMQDCIDAHMANPPPVVQYEVRPPSSTPTGVQESAPAPETD